MKIKLDTLRDYLKNKGWEFSKFNDKLDMIRLDETTEEDGIRTYQKIEIVIPNSEELKDYTSRINDLIASLASIEGRSLHEVIADLDGDPILELIKIRDKLLNTIPNEIEAGEFPHIIKQHIDELDKLIDRWS